jgi:hypothetical protein
MRRFRAATPRVYSRPSAIDYNEPCIIKNLTNQWPAVCQRKWEPRHLQAKYGERLFERGRCTGSNETLITTLNCVLRCRNPRLRLQNYIFDSTFDADCPELLADYSVPEIFDFNSRIVSSAVLLPPSEHSNRWFLVGHAGSGSRLHIDPAQTSAWNALAFGLKEWVIFEPEIPLHSSSCHPSSPGLSSADSFYDSFRRTAASTPLHRWFRMQVSLLWQHARCVTGSRGGSAVDISSTPRMMRFTQLPGDLIYIPCGWQHAVLNRCLSIAITHNFYAPESYGG